MGLCPFSIVGIQLSVFSGQLSVAAFLVTEFHPKVIFQKVSLVREKLVFHRSCSPRTDN